MKDLRKHMSPGERRLLAPWITPSRSLPKVRNGSHRFITAPRGSRRFSLVAHLSARLNTVQRGRKRLSTAKRVGSTRVKHVQHGSCRVKLFNAVRHGAIRLNADELATLGWRRIRLATRSVREPVVRSAIRSWTGPFENTPVPVRLAGLPDPNRRGPQPIQQKQVTRG